MVSFVIAFCDFVHSHIGFAVTNAFLPVYRIAFNAQNAQINKKTSVFFMGMWYL